jgi:predicted unusual protein kinase regulating ubiquinone biosynthesis (AarF/ABC1/UbiB family)
MNSRDKDTFGKRTRRYARVGQSAAKAGARYIGAKIVGDSSQHHNAAILRAALGGLKGPLMKVAQLIATIPDFLPPAYAAELATLQSQAPSMGWPFVRRRMAGELGNNWSSKFASFEQNAASAASLGQVHRATAHDGTLLACKLQYPDMAATIEADLQQLKIVFGLFETFGGSISTKDAYKEIATRLREELDYRREAANMAAYRQMLAPLQDVHVPETIPALSTDRLLTMTWLEGQKLDDVIVNKSQKERNAIAATMFRAWYLPFYRYGIIHGDPHLGNYTLREDNGINLLDFGCIRVFRPSLVEGVIRLFEALRNNDNKLAVEAYQLWGFSNIGPDLLEALNLWARFVYAPVLQDEARPIHETNSTQAGRQVAAEVYKKVRLIKGMRVPPEFVMIDRASIGLGSLFLRLNAEVNWYNLFQDMTEDFDPNTLAKRQANLLEQNGLSFDLTENIKPERAG